MTDIRLRYVYMSYSFLIYFWGSDITLELNIAEKIKLTQPVTANEISTKR